MSTSGDNSSVRSGIKEDSTDQVRRWIEEDNQALVRRWIEESNKGSAAIIDKFISTNYVHHDPANPKVRNLDEFKKDRQKFPKMHAKVDHITAEADRVVTRIIWHGTYTGQWRGLPPPPSNEEVMLSAISSFRIAGGKIAEFWFDEVERQKKKEYLTRYLAKGLFTIVFLGVLVILAIHLRYSYLPIDAVTFGLLVIVMGLLIVAILPWLSNFLQSAKFPGGWELEFRSIRAEQIQQKSEIQSQRTQIEQLYALSMGTDAFNQLKKLATGSFGSFYLDPELMVGLATELNYLKILGYIEFDKVQGVVDTRYLPKGNQPDDNLSKYIRVTKQGHDFVALREQVLKNA
jgi:predicted ester cyclase